MRRGRLFVVIGLVVATIGASGTAATAKPAPDAPGGLAGAPGSTLPPNAVPGSTPERRAAWDRLSPQARQQKLAEFQALVGARLQADSRLRAELAAAKAWPGVAGSAPAWTDVVSGRPAKAGQGSASATPHFTRGTAPRPDAAGVAGPGAGVAGPGAGVAGPGVQAVDLDGDGLDQGFEAQVADAFTPLYHVSAGERAGTGFATFFNSVPQTVAQVFGPVPPISYFRVQPLGFATDSAGTPVGVLRIDYLTLWNRDDGFNLGGICGAAVGLVESLIGADLRIGGHNLDNERAAALVAAPVVGGGYNPDPGAYGAYSYYTAAHEGNPFGDNSAYYFFDPPVSAGLHIELGLSRSKHATYTFNPAGFPVIRPEIMAFTYAVIDSLYFSGAIDFDTYLLFLFLADQAFFACVVEDFIEQGGFYAGSRIDVGEPSQPINGAGFIQDDQSGIRQKLTVPLW